MAKLTPSKQRVYFIDNLRAFLTALVILHHTAVAYGGSGTWPYKSPDHDTSPTLLAFNELNQSYFMDLFFYVSGRQTRSSSTAPWEYLKGKVLRLGLLTMVVTCFGYPGTLALVRWHEGEAVDWSFFREYWASLRGVNGPVWYCATLLIFDLMIALGFMHTQEDQPSQIPIMNFFTVYICIVFLVRCFFPLSNVFRPLNLQLGYAPQYVFAYFMRIPIYLPFSKEPLLDLLGALIILLATLGVLARNPRFTQDLKGGFNGSALSYAAWNEICGYLIGSAVYPVFKMYCHQSWHNLPRYSFTAFLVHPTICVIIEIALGDLRMNGVPMTMIVGPLSIVGCWAAGWLMLRVPGLKNVI